VLSGSAPSFALVYLCAPNPPIIEEKELAKVVRNATHLRHSLNGGKEGKEKEDHCSRNSKAEKGHAYTDVLVSRRVSLKVI
jgi:hypothetical protein